MAVAEHRDSAVPRPRLLREYPRVHADAIEVSVGQEAAFLPKLKLQLPRKLREKVTVSLADAADVGAPVSTTSADDGAPPPLIARAAAIMACATTPG